MTDMMDEVVTRSAPRWAWDLIDETLTLDSQSGAFDQKLREQIERAQNAMLMCCEDPEIDQASEKRAKAWADYQFL